MYLIDTIRDGDASSELVIEDMAHVYIPLLLTAQPRGQFRLGGYCNGGLLAWEIAHRLHHAGREGRICHPYQHFLTECATSIARPQSIAVWPHPTRTAEYFEISRETELDVSALEAGAVAAE